MAGDTHKDQGLLLSDDMIFSSRIIGTARDYGFAFGQARSPRELEELARRPTLRCVIVDLSNPGLVIALLIQHLRVICSPMPRVVAYGSHVDTVVLQEAREAGCDVVLPRSKFVLELPKELAAWMRD